MWLKNCFVFSAVVDDDTQQDIKREDKSQTETPPNQGSVCDSKDSEQAENPTLPPSSPVTSSLLPSTPLSPSLTLPPATPQPVSPTSESAKELARRSASDVSSPKSPSKPQPFTSRRRSSTSQGSSVTTRFRAQTAFENVSLCLTNILYIHIHVELMWSKLYKATHAYTIEARDAIQCETVFYM